MNESLAVFLVKVSCMGTISLIVTVAIGLLSKN